MSKTIILAACGVRGGAEFHESVLTLLELEMNETFVSMFCVQYKPIPGEQPLNG